MIYYKIHHKDKPGGDTEMHKTTVCFLQYQGGPKSWEKKKMREPQPISLQPSHGPYSLEALGHKNHAAEPPR